MDEPGVELSFYLANNPGTKVALWCNTCGYLEKWEIAGTIARLDRQGINGRAFGIRALAGRVKKSCPQCGLHNWETRPDFPPARMGTGR